ncbi:MAG: hypothetical protein M1832_005223 [Thelocarpon impressellum]|nr:MAG: hypothetical protein M1832_005223 [Thelocarpon impressellum]
MAPPAGIPEAPAPWTCKCEAYWLLFYATGPLPDHAYAPLEQAAATFSDPASAGSFKGGLGTIQIVRYSDTPAGSYDELLLIPGFFERPGKRGKHMRVTRIYVSQKVTCYNGRKNWGIPKHLARFSFSHPPTAAGSPPTKTLKVEVFPPDEGATRPFFSALLHPFEWAPAVPFTTKAMPLVGMDPHLVQPPVPGSGKAGEEMLTSSEGWLKTLPHLHTSRARGMWAEVTRGGKKGGAGGGAGGGQDGEAEALLPGDQVATWWPKIEPWKIGLWLENATLVFTEPEILE